jgi:hypothetical protein
LVRAGTIGDVRRTDDGYVPTWTDREGEKQETTTRTGYEAVNATQTRRGWWTTGSCESGAARHRGHENMISMLQLYARRTEHDDRILDALGGGPAPARDDDEDGPNGSLTVVSVRADAPECSRWNGEGPTPGFGIGPLTCGGRYWYRTSDLFGVNEALYP